MFDNAGGATTAVLKQFGQMVEYTYSTGIWNSVASVLPLSRLGGNMPFAKSAIYTASSGDIVMATAGAGGWVLTLPAVARGAFVYVKKVDSGAGTITITPASGTIDGASTLGLVVQYDVAMLVSDGVGWFNLSAFVGSAGQESVIRANTLSEMAAPTAAINMNSQNFTNLEPAIVAAQAPTVGQLAGNQYAYIVSGCLWTPDSAGSTRAASMTAGTVMIKGILLTVGAVTSRSFTASSDTYVDFTDNGDGTAAITYSVVGNNALAPALAGTTHSTRPQRHLLVGASNIAAQANINQGAPAPGASAGRTGIDHRRRRIERQQHHDFHSECGCQLNGWAGLAIVDTSVGTGGNFGSLISYSGGGGTTR